MFVGSTDIVRPLPSTSHTAAVSSEHSYCVQESPRKLKREAATLQDRLECYQKKLKSVQQTSRRLVKKVESLEDVIKMLKRKDLVSDNCISVLEKCLSGASLQLILCLLAKHKHIPFSHQQYPPELRAFALTLNFYSTKAYNFVRNTFDLCLPHHKTISKWYQSVDGNAGFSAQALQTVQAHATAVGQQLFCALIMDEMAIRRQVEWDGK